MARRQGHGTGLVEGDELEGTRLRLVEWRKQHKTPARIPAELWTKAVELAGRYGLAQTARALRLDYSSLKRKMAANVATLPALPQFVELLAPVSGSIAECALEVESPRGARMRVVLKNVAPLGLASIIRDFAG
jgi:hypothetical protein